MPKRPCEIEVIVDPSLNYLSHDAANARKRANGEQKGQSNLLPRRHPHLIEKDQWHRQEGEVKGAVDDRQAIAQLVAVATLVRCRVTTSSKDTEFEVDGPRALEEFREQGRDHETYNKNEEDIVRDHPSAGRQAR